MISLERRGRELALGLDGVPVATLRFGVPGEPEPPADVDEWLRTRLGAVVTRVRLFEDLDATSLSVTVENTGAEPVEAPPVGVAIEPDAGWAGWAWTRDVEGFVMLAGANGGVVVQLRQGFLRVASELPVFASEPRADAFHLVRPGMLAPGTRQQTVLRLARAAAHPDAAGSLLPAWLPDLVVPEGTEISLVTPDRGIVPGPGVEAAADGGGVLLSGPAGHGEVALHDVRGVQRIRLTWSPRLEPWLADLAHALRSRRPSAMSTATGAVVAQALARGAVLDREAVVDWLEHEDWLARGEALGVATASVLGAQTGDAQLLTDAWDAALALPAVPGRGLVVVRAWLALLSGTGAAPDLAGALLGRPAMGPDAALEVSLLGGGDEARDAPFLLDAVRRLGGSLPGRPLGLAAPDAALLVCVLRLCPEGWELRRTASDTAEKGAALLLADYADGLHSRWDGLAWLLVGQLGA